MFALCQGWSASGEFLCMLDQQYYKVLDFVSVGIDTRLGESWMLAGAACADVCRLRKFR